MPTQQVVINLPAELDIPVGNMSYVEFNETAPYVDLTGVGVINITDFQTTFGGTILSKVAKLDLFVLIGGNWQDWSVPPENITYVSNLLTTIRWTLNAPTITKLYGRIY